MNTQYRFRCLALTCSLILFAFSASWGQRFFSVVFDKLPQDRQMYARDDQNEAAIPVSGVIEVTGFTHMSMVIFREGVRVGYAKSVLQYGSNTKTSFAMSGKIKAELAEYAIVVYACRTADSIQMVRRDQVIAGDFYLINGQSNAAAVNAYRVSAPEYVTKFSRTLGRTPDLSSGFSAADTTWKTTDWVTPGVGYWGRDIQRQIMENYQIPVCVINGAVPGTKIADHLGRNGGNPADPGNIYGHLLYRTLRSKATRIRAFFWYQGEQDAWFNPEAYPASFNTLMSYWQTDYPMVDKFVIIQINIMDRPNYEAGALRELQRKAKYTNPRTDHFSVIGLGPIFDNVHYTEEGYGKLATQLTDYLGPRHYKSSVNKNIDSPDIQKVFYSKTKDAITLIFDENQVLKWPADTTVGGITTKLKDQFFLNGDETKPAPISSWEVKGNRVTLRLSAPATATKLNYLPSYKDGYYHGPFLRNSRGLGAFSFHEFAIAPALTDPAIASALSGTNTVLLSWQKVTDATSYILERKAEGETEFSVLKTIDNNSTTSYEDLAVTYNKTYSYQLRGISTLSETVSETSIKTLPLLATEPRYSDMNLKIYPNPAKDYLDLEFASPATGDLALLATNGKQMLAKTVVSATKVHLEISTIPAGVYLLTLTRKNGSVLTSRMVKF